LRALSALVLLAGAVGWHAGDTVNAAEVALESRVKAAFLYQMAGYVEWPSAAFPRPDTPITIAVAGAEAIGDELARIVPGRTVQNRTIAVRQVKDPSALAGVHVVFVGDERKSQLKEFATRAREQGVLLVTESEGALSEGSMVNFVLLDGRVRFEVALDPARRSGIKLSSRLLSVAHQVHAGAP
jgi:uncharacterized protein DUF4154